MNLSAEQLQANFDTLIKLIDNKIASPRKEKLIEFYKEHQERLMLMPASGTKHYHNCWPGGYVDHVLRVAGCALKVKKIWLEVGSTIDFTDEELIFSAINHDLGKIGTEQAEQYIPNPSDWHIKNQGKVYINNPANPFMTVPDRGLKLLADRGISVSDNEWFGIKLHDGMYEDANKAYYVSYKPESRLRTKLPYILHQADMMASVIEADLEAQRAPAKTTPAANKDARTQQALADAFKKTFQ